MIDATDKVTSHWVQWKWGYVAALFITALSLYPQLHLLLTKNGTWYGSYAYVDSDEMAYSSYANALIEGLPRRTDPYTSVGSRPNEKQHESYFSVQFFPPYVVANLARLLGISTSTAFILIMPIAAFATSIVLFFLLTQITHDNRLSAMGVIVVLCLGTLVSLQGPLGTITSQFGWGYLPFLRRYIPAVPFPMFILMFVLMWRLLTTSNLFRTFYLSAITGICFVILVFSYFYLWTTAAAWLFSFMVTWLLCDIKKWRQVLLSSFIICTLSSVALIFYFYLLSLRHTTIDNVMALSTSHRPDLFWPSEILGVGILLFLAWLIKWKNISYKQPAIILAASLCLTSLITFNQQIITGRSLQPFHYQQFTTCYLVLIAIIIALSLWLNTRDENKRQLSSRALFWISVFSFFWGTFEASGTARGHFQANVLRDDMIPAVNKLRELVSDNKNTVLVTNMIQSDNLPTLISMPVLWAPHMESFSGITPDEEKERFFQYLYYTGVSEEALLTAIKARNVYVCYALFGWERLNPLLAVNFNPITLSEEQEAAKKYGEYVKNFGPENAMNPTLSYLMVPTEEEVDLSNIDKWYVREGEAYGPVMLYKLRLR